MLYSYVPSSVKCSIFGVELDGLSKDSFISIERIDPISTFRRAQDGTRVAFYDAYSSYRVTINVEQVSESNDFLHSILKLHQRAGLNLKIPLNIEEKSNNGGTRFTSFDTFFETEPVADFSSESGSRSWVFVCNNATYQLKGTADTGFITGALQATIRLIELSEAFGIDLTDFEELIKEGVDIADSKLKGLF
jgi:hypothetical protein